jgi:hypothetical protein
MEKALPIPIKISVPMMAFEIPPPISPTGLGSSVRNLQLITEKPLLAMKKRMKSIGRMEHKVRRMMTILNDLSHIILLLIEGSFMLSFLMLLHPSGG